MKSKETQISIQKIGYIVFLCAEHFSAVWLRFKMFLKNENDSILSRQCFLGLYFSFHWKKRYAFDYVKWSVNNRIQKALFSLKDNILTCSNSQTKSLIQQDLP